MVEVVEHVQDTWLYCQNKNANKHSIYKLHAALADSHFDSHHRTVYQFLKKAVEDGIIPAFKILNIGSGAVISSEINAESATFKEDPNVRLLVNPFTIYLYDDFDVHQISLLCKQIEVILQEVPPYNPDQVSIADLPLTPHITFRQEQLNNQYVAIATAPEETLEQLKIQGLSSSEYQRLKQTVVLETKSELRTAVKEKEAFIQDFYNNHYMYFEKQLKSQNVMTQFDAACELLKINPNQLKEKKTEQEWLAVIKQGYYQASSLYHPNSLRSCQTTTEDKTSEIFKLVGIADTILKHLAKEPSIVDSKKWVEQQPYRPNHQYELAQGFEIDPFYYVFLAKSTKYVVLRKNWDLTYQLQTINEASSEIQIYKPQINIYDPDQHKTVLLRGNEAFFELFMADALPRKFGQYHFHYIFDDKPYNEAVRYLADKVLSTIKLMSFINTSDLISLSINATKENIKYIGNNVSEVFLYFYKNHPEALNVIYVENFIQNPGFDSAKITEFILQEPQNLFRLIKMDEVSSISKELKKYIYNDKALAKKLFSNKTDKYLKHIFIQNKIDEKNSLIITQLFFDNNLFLSALSTHKLNEIREIVIKSKGEIPDWLAQDIDNEIYARINSSKLLSFNKNQQSAYSGYSSLIDPIVYCKDRLLKGDESILSILNQEALIFLADQREVQWIHYFNIATALIGLGNEDAAKKYLNVVARELDIVAGSATEIISIIKSKESELSKLYQEYKEREISRLLVLLRETIFRKQEDQEYEDILHHLSLLGEQANKGTNEIKEEYYQILKIDFFRLYERLVQGERTEELKQEFYALQKEFKKIKFSFESMINNFIIKAGHEKILMKNLYFLIEKAIWEPEETLTPYSVSDNKYCDFNLNFSKNTLIILKDIYYIYDCFGERKEFFSNLKLKINIEVNAQLEFDENALKEAFLQVLDNEFSVFIDGKRENVSYKRVTITGMLVDNKNIKSFESLYSLYLRLGELQHLGHLLPHAYQKLADAENLTGSNFIDEQDKRRPLNKYREIRTYFEQKSTILEPLLLKYMPYMQAPKQTLLITAPVPKQKTIKIEMPQRQAIIERRVPPQFKITAPKELLSNVEMKLSENNIKFEYKQDCLIVYSNLNQAKSIIEKLEHSLDLVNWHEEFALSANEQTWQAEFENLDVLESINRASEHRLKLFNTDLFIYQLSSFKENDVGILLDVIKSHNFDNFQSLFFKQLKKHSAESTYGKFLRSEAENFYKLWCLKYRKPYRLEQLQPLVKAWNNFRVGFHPEQETIFLMYLDNKPENYSDPAKLCEVYPLYEQAAKASTDGTYLGSQEAQFMLACFNKYCQHDFNNFFLDKGVVALQYSNASKSNHLFSMQKLAKMHLLGDGVDKSYDKATSLLYEVIVQNPLLRKQEAMTFFMAMVDGQYPPALAAFTRLIAIRLEVALYYFASHIDFFKELEIDALKTELAKEVSAPIKIALSESFPVFVIHSLRQLHYFAYSVILQQGSTFVHSEAKKSLDTFFNNILSMQLLAQNTQSEQPQTITPGVDASGKANVTSESSFAPPGVDGDSFCPAPPVCADDLMPVAVGESPAYTSHFPASSEDVNITRIKTMIDDLTSEINSFICINSDRKLLKLLFWVMVLNSEKNNLNDKVKFVLENQILLDYIPTTDMLADEINTKIKMVVNDFSTWDEIFSGFLSKRTPELLTDIMQTSVPDIKKLCYKPS